MKILLGQGTWGFDDDWWRPKSAFCNAIGAAGHEILNGDPFLWDTNLGGVQIGDKDLWGWRAWGQALITRVKLYVAEGQLKPEELCIISHSHFRQIVRFATHTGLKVPQVIYVSGPVRKDVNDITPLSRGNIGNIVTIHGGRRDRMQVFGGLLDGHWGILRDDKEADEAYVYKDADHSSFLKNPAHFDYVVRHIKRG